VMAAGVRFGCVLADAGYGLSAPFRQGLIPTRTDSDSSNLGFAQGFGTKYFIDFK